MTEFTEKRTHFALEGEKSKSSPEEINIIYYDQLLLIYNIKKNEFYFSQEAINWSQIKLHTLLQQ